MKDKAISEHKEHEIFLKNYQSSVVQISRIKKSYAEKLYIIKSLNLYIGNVKTEELIIELIADVELIELHSESDVQKFKIFQNKILELELFFNQLKSKKIAKESIRFNKFKETRILTDVEQLYDQLNRVNDKIKLNLHEYVKSVKILNLDKNKNFLKKLNLSDLIILE